MRKKALGKLLRSSGCALSNQGKKHCLSEDLPCVPVFTVEQRGEGELIGLRIIDPQASEDCEVELTRVLSARIPCFW